MKQVDVLIVGGGLAGIACAFELINTPISVLLIESESKLGGQWCYRNRLNVSDDLPVKHTIAQIEMSENIEVLTKHNCLGVYEDGIINIAGNQTYLKVYPNYIVIASGTIEKSMAFKGNAMTNTYGLAATQKLLALGGLKKEHCVFIAGAENLAYLLATDILRTGASISAILVTAPSIGTSTISRKTFETFDFPIYKGYEIETVLGDNVVKGIRLKEKMSKKTIDINCNFISYNEGLIPHAELLWRANCKMDYSEKLGGFIPQCSPTFETSVSNIFAAGDVIGILGEEAAFLQGHLTGLYLIATLLGETEDRNKKIVAYRELLNKVTSKQQRS